MEQPKMNIEMRKLTDIFPYDNNPRLNDSAVDIVAQSIQAYGFKQPIVVDKDGVIVAGHTRFRAVRKLGYEEVPVIVADDLSDEQIKAFRIMDNKSGEYADWDYIKLLEELEVLQNVDYDIELTGFSDVELKHLINDTTEKVKKKEKADKAEVEFTEELLEEHQYVVLHFDNTLDWNVAQELFEMPQVKALWSKEDFEKTGMGRVINGSKWLDVLRRGKEEEDVSLW